MTMKTIPSRPLSSRLARLSSTAAQGSTPVLGLALALTLAVVLAPAAAFAAPPDQTTSPAGAPDQSAPDRSPTDQTPTDQGSPERLPTYPVDQIHRGQTGYGLTVFNGDVPERFDVEVLGVLRNTDPQMTYVLARLSGHGLEHDGVIQGMSGSPVFIDGRLVGAVAFGWPFATEAIAGITPIEAMRSIGELPSGMPARPPEPMPMPGAGTASATGPAVTAATAASAAGDPPRLEDLAALASGGSGEAPEDVLEHALEALRPRVSSVAPGASSAVGWVTSGFGDASRSVLETALGQVSPTGAAAADETTPLRTGGPVAAVLVDGDLQLAATGTVTERHGDEILAFGHSFLGLGPLSVPMAASEIITVLPSRYNSFKISNLGPVVGAFEQDAQSGIRGRIGLDAPMIPYTLRVKGVRDREFHMRMAALPDLVPALTAAATVGCLDSASFSGGPQGIDVAATFHLAGWGDLDLHQSFDGAGAANSASAYLVSMISFLVRNPYREVEITGLDVTLTQATKPRVATLVAAHAEHTVVRPGDRVRVNLDLKSYRGEMFRRSVEVPLPDDLAAGPLYLMVGDGASADAARLTIEPSDPVTFSQALDLLRSFHSNRELVVLLVVRASGLSVGGSSLPRLPGSVQSIWKAAASGSAKPLTLAVTETEAGELPFPADGLVRIDLEVRRREPFSEEGGASDRSEGSGEADGASAGGGESGGHGAVDASGPPSQRPPDEKQTGQQSGKQSGQQSGQQSGRARRAAAPREEMR